MLTFEVDRTMTVRQLDEWGIPFPQAEEGSARIQGEAAPEASNTWFVVAGIGWRIRSQRFMIIKTTARRAAIWEALLRV